MRTSFVLWISSFVIHLASAQDSPAVFTRLSRDFFKNGEQTLLAFEPISRATRDSVVKLDLNGNTVALAAVIDASGLAVTKASEIKEGKLTAWLANGKEVDVQFFAKDDENDLALVQVNAKNLKATQWATGETSVGQWVITPGIAETPQAVGIVSVPPRKIPPPRAYLGVVLDFKSPDAKIAQVLEGLGAEAAGLKPGDVILALNDSLVDEGKQLVKTLRQFREGQAVKVRVQRGEEEFVATIKMMAPKPERGRGFDRADRMNQMGSVTSQRAEDFELAIQHDTVLQNWQCGGPLMNLDGKAVGLNIARAGRVASYALPASVLIQAIARLQTQAETTGRKTGQLKTSQPLEERQN
ncbi:MAG TPA: PDZ domain-containing protein [Candidatus Eisenbacteria bacterium]|nr:PDZ domain-containing protein [Candidatus Eisenbacteria bacterium]